MEDLESVTDIACKVMVIEKSPPTRGNLHLWRKAVFAVAACNRMRLAVERQRADNFSIANQDSPNYDCLSSDEVLSGDSNEGVNFELDDLGIVGSSSTGVVHNLDPTGLSRIDNTASALISESSSITNAHHRMQAQKIRPATARRPYMEFQGLEAVKKRRRSPAAAKRDWSSMKHKGLEVVKKKGLSCKTRFEFELLQHDFSVKADDSNPSQQPYSSFIELTKETRDFLSGQKKNLHSNQSVKPEYSNPSEQGASDVELTKETRDFLSGQKKNLHSNQSVKPEYSNPSEQGASDVELTKETRDFLSGQKKNLHSSQSVKPEYSNPSEQGASDVVGFTRAILDSIFVSESKCNISVASSRPESKSSTSRTIHFPRLHFPQHTSCVPASANRLSAFRPWIIQQYPTSTVLGPRNTAHVVSIMSEDYPNPLWPPVHLNSDGDAAAPAPAVGGGSTNEAATSPRAEIVKPWSFFMNRCRPKMEWGHPTTKPVHRGDDDSSAFGVTDRGNQTCRSIDQLMREVDDRREDGYFLGSEWLLGLEQNQRESLMSILSKSGYSETSHTGMTILFERIRFDSQNGIDVNNPSSLIMKCNICDEDREQDEAPKKGDVLERSNIDKLPGIATSHNLEHLPEASWAGGWDVPIAGTTRTVEYFSHVTNSTAASPMVEDQLMIERLEGKDPETCITNYTRGFSLEQQSKTVNSFLSVLKSSRQQSYAVNTDWLSSLKDHEKTELETKTREAGYTKMHQDSSTTTFERIRDDVGLPPTNLCNNPRRTSDKTGLGISDTEQEASGTDGLLRNDKLKGKLDDADNKTELVGFASTVEKTRTAGEDSRCHPQILKVTCSSISQASTMPSTSSSHCPLRHSRRQQFGDSIVTMPRKGESRTISTTMEKPLSMTTVDFSGGKNACNEVCVRLKAIATTTIGCCISFDQNPRKIRVKFSKIRGEVKRDGCKEQRCNALVLSSLRTNVYACINNEESEGESDEIILKLEDEYFVPPRRRVIGDHVWLNSSEISPDNCESGSITLELQGDVRKRCKADLAAQVQRAHVLHFQEPRPVVLQGEVPVALDPNLFLELNVKCQLEVSYIKPCTPIPKEAKFVAGRRISEVVNFDCTLDFMIKKFSFD